MTAIPFNEYLRLLDDCIKCTSIIDLDTVPSRHKLDYMQRNTNVQLSRILCGRCDGTGNEFFSMYKTCTACSGLGYSLKET